MCNFQVETRLLSLQDGCPSPHEERAIALVRHRFHVPATPSAAPSSVIRDASTVQLSFNVMAGRFVTETFHCKEYRVWPGYVEADFSRSYESQMAQSPSHVILATAEAHAQKLAYIALAEVLGTPYAATQPEYFKIWWTSCYCNVPKMIRKEDSLRQSLWVLEFQRSGPTSYSLEIYSRVSGSMEILARAGVLLI
jgi:hypothetical protein